MTKSDNYSWSTASAAIEKARQRASGSYTPLEKLADNNEKRASMVDQVQEILTINDDEIFGDSSEEEEEEEDFTYLPKLSTLWTTMTTTEDNHKQHINSIRKNRPLPKPPVKITEKESSNDLSTNNLTQVFNDSLKSQNKLAAQQLFLLMSQNRLSSSAPSSSSSESEGDEEDKCVASNVASGIGYYMNNIQLPANNNNNDNNNNYHYDHYNSSFYKLMTPVQEVEEEDQLFDIAQIARQDEEEEEEEEELPNFLLEPVVDTQSFDESSGDHPSSLRPSVSQLYLSSPSLLIASGRSSPSSVNSHQSVETSGNVEDHQVAAKEDMDNVSNDDDGQLLGKRYNSNNNQQFELIQPQHRELRETDILNDIDSSMYEFQEPVKFDYHNSYNSKPTENISLLSDVKRLSLLNQALQSPSISYEDLNPMDEKQQQHQQHQVPVISNTPSNDDYRNIDSNMTDSPHAAPSLSLIHDKESIKTYRRMATKTKNRNIQFTFAKYLLQLVAFYNHKVETSTATEEGKEEDISTRNRLQEEAEYWIDKLAKSNHAEALYIKGQWHKNCNDQSVSYYISSQYKKVNHAKAFRCFQQSAKFGLAEAHYEMAEYLVERKEYKKAISSYRYAASQDHFLSLYKLANILLRGLLSQEKDIRQGLIYLKKAADLNQPECARPAYDLACIYSNDLETIGLDRNSIITPSISSQTFSLAVHYYEKADYFGLVAATYRLGTIFEYGHLNTEVSVWEAYTYYKRAAEKKHEGAMLELSRLYKEGVPNCLEASAQRAYQWCLKATENGNEVAEYVMGTYHESGVATRPDYSQAIAWCKKSASKGYSPAENKLEIPYNKRVSRCQMGNNELQEKTKQQQEVPASKKNKKYYEESVRIVEKSRRIATAVSNNNSSSVEGDNCQIM